MRSRIFAIAGAAWIALFVFAFVAAPRSCEWGLTAYFWAGVLTLVTLLAVPNFVQSDRPVLRRAGLGLALAAATLIVWTAGLFAANVRILCRLF